MLLLKHQQQQKQKQIKKKKTAQVNKIEKAIKVLNEESMKKINWLIAKKKKRQKDDDVLFVD